MLPSLKSNAPAQQRNEQAKSLCSTKQGYKSMQSIHQSFRTTESSFDQAHDVLSTRQRRTVPSRLTSKSRPRQTSATASTIPVSRIPYLGRAKFFSTWTYAGG